MAKNFKSGIVAGVIAVTIATAGITTVSSFTLVSEAQAWSIKKAYKKTTRVAKRKYNKTKRKVNNAKNVVTGKRCKGGAWINNHGLCGMTVNPIPRIPNGRIGDLPNNHDHRG